MTALIIADDHPLFRAALRRAAADTVEAAEIHEAESLDEVLDVLESHDIDLMLLDLHMPGNHGLAGLAKIRALQPGIAVVVVSASDDPGVIRRALDLGAAGYLPKSSGLGDVDRAMRCVLDGERWLPAALQSMIAHAPPISQDADLASRIGSLTSQQYRVLGMVAEGLLNKQIADRLGLQLRTIKAHMTRIMDHLGVRNRAQAIGMLHQLGLHDPSRRPLPEPLDHGDEGDAGELS